MKFKIQKTDSGCIIRDNGGNFVLETPTEEEALEWIEENENTYSTADEVNINPYNQFVVYCNKLPGKCFLDRQLATTNEKALKKFIKSFEASRNFKVNYITDYVEDEYFYIVTDVN